MYKYLILTLLFVSCQSSADKPHHPSPCDLSGVTYDYIDDNQLKTVSNVIDIGQPVETNYFLGSDFISETKITITYVDTTCCCLKSIFIVKKKNLMTNESMAK